MNMTKDFEFVTGSDILDPETFVELPRPGEGRANEAGDLVFVASSKFSVSERRCVSFTLSICYSFELEPYINVHVTH